LEILAKNSYLFCRASGSLRRSPIVGPVFVAAFGHSVVVERQELVPLLNTGTMINGYPKSNFTLLLKSNSSDGCEPTVHLLLIGWQLIDGSESGQTSKSTASWAIMPNLLRAAPPMGLFSTVAPIVCPRIISTCWDGKAMNWLHERRILRKQSIKN
jgi:hypothetical protein